MVPKVKYYHAIYSKIFKLHYFTLFGIKPLFLGNLMILLSAMSLFFNIRYFHHREKNYVDTTCFVCKILEVDSSGQCV